MDTRNQFIRNLFRAAAIIAAIALPLANHAFAERLTQIVEFSTLQGSETNHLTINGTLDTLAQGLRQVNYGSASVTVQGSLRAEITFDTFQEQDPQIVGVTFLANSFSQQDMTLTYDVPSTTRRVTFTTSNVNFSLDLENILPSGQQGNLFQQTQMAGPGMAANSYQLVQNNGTSQIAITNRPSKQQNLFEQQITSAYVDNSTSPSALFALFSVAPPDQSNPDYQVTFNVPLSFQQVHYTGVGLPVTLDYGGTLQLVGQLPLINNSVPEPTGIALSMLAAAGLLLRRRVI